MAKFIVFEGVDRCGKSTQIKKVSEWLTRVGIENIVIQEPGTTTLGTMLRMILKDRNIPCCYKAQKALFHAARVQLVEEVIRPNLEKGITVLCDRYFLSTLCYQILPQSQKNKNLCRDFVDTVNTYVKEISEDIILPDITLIFHIDKNTYENRGLNRTTDRFEELDTFTKKVMDNYQMILATSKILGDVQGYKMNIGETVIGINSNYSEDVVFNDIVYAIEPYCTK